MYVLLLQKESGKMKQILRPIGKENVKKSIIAIGQELIKRAEDITNDIEFVQNIEINAKLTVDEVTNFDIKKNYIARLDNDNLQINKLLKFYNYGKMFIKEKTKTNVP